MLPFQIKSGPHHVAKVAGYGTLELEPTLKFYVFTLNTPNGTFYGGTSYNSLFGSPQYKVTSSAADL